MLRKYKHNMQKRIHNNERSKVIYETTRYSKEMMGLATDDTIVKQYQNKMKRRVQWEVLIHQHYPILFGLFVYGVTRRLKAYRESDKMYFAVPWAFLTWACYGLESKNAFQEGYPAHPVIIQHRTNLINQTCFTYPQILKNEIEYLQLKLQQNREDTDDVHKFEKEFRTGFVSSDYKKAFDEASGKKLAKAESDENQIRGKRFKFIVEDGELNL